MQIDGISAIAVIVIASFAIDRIVTAILFGLSMLERWNRWFPDPKLLEDDADKHKAAKKQTILYFGLALILAVPLLSWYGGVRIFSVLGFPEIDPILDTIVTGLILVAGADRVAGFVKLAGGGGGASVPSSQPVEITGKLVLQDDGKTERKAQTADLATSGSGSA